MGSRADMASWIEELQSQGRYTITRTQAEEQSGAEEGPVSIDTVVGEAVKEYLDRY